MQCCHKANIECLMLSAWSKRNIFTYLQWRILGVGRGAPAPVKCAKSCKISEAIFYHLLVKIASPPLSLRSFQILAWFNIFFNPWKSEHAKEGEYLKSMGILSLTILNPTGITRRLHSRWIQKLPIIVHDHAITYVVYYSEPLSTD